VRNVYVNKQQFLSPNISAAEVWVRSTDYYRTIQSAQVILSSLNYLHYTILTIYHQGNLLGLFPSNDADTEIPIIDMYTMDMAVCNNNYLAIACKHSLMLLEEREHGGE
jgi:hypothetical protein